MSTIKPLNKWDKYWRLTILWEPGYIEYWKNVRCKRTAELCECDCWNVLLVRRDYLVNWHTKSCGCFALEEKRNRITHWDSRESWWSGLYIVYSWIIWRCYNKNSSVYKNYWWRWIECLWKSYEDFKADMEESYILHCEEFGRENTSLDRIDNDWNYCKENCRRATKKEQSNNRRSNIKLPWKWNMMNLTEIYDLEKPRVKFWTFYYRYRNWWDLESALFKDTWAR